MLILPIPILPCQFQCGHANPVNAVNDNANQYKPTLTLPMLSMLNTNAVNDNAKGTITAFSHNTITVYITYSNWLSQKGCAWGDRNS